MPGGILTSLLSECRKSSPTDPTRFFSVARELNVDLNELMIFVGFWMTKAQELGSKISPMNVASAFKDERGTTMVRILEILIKEGWGVNDVNKIMEPPLITALGNGNIAAAKKLIEYGADCKVYGRDGINAMAAAVNDVNSCDTIITAIKLLIKAGVSLNDPTDKNSKEKPLHRAVFLNKPKTVSFLLKAGADANSIDGEGNTPIHIAVIINNCELIKVLYKHGVNLLITNRRDHTPLSMAVMFGKVSTLKTFIECGFHVDGNTHPRKSTLLQYSVMILKDEMVRLLVDSKADLNKSTDTADTPIQTLANGAMFVEERSEKDINTSRFKILDLLVDNGADVNCGATDNVKPLCLAINKNLFKLADELIRCGANINLELDYSHMFHYAVGSNSDLIITFLEFGGDYNVLNVIKQTPYQFAYKVKADLKYIKGFVKWGCPYNQVFPDLSHLTEMSHHLWRQIVRSTCKHEYIQFWEAQERFFHGLNNNDLLLVQGSVKAGAVPTSCSVETPYPLHEVVSNGYKALTEFLLENNFPPNCLNEKGETPLIVAAKAGHLAICKLLLKHGACYKYVFKNEVQTKFKNKKIVDLFSGIDSLFQLTRSNPRKVVNELKAKLSLDKKEFLVFKNVKNAKGQTLLEAVLQNGHLKSAVQIMELGLKYTDDKP